MGNTNSSQTAQAITQSIAKNMVSSISSVSSDSTAISEIKSTCKWYNEKVDCDKLCLNAAERLDWSADEVASTCPPLCGCVIENIDMSQILVISTDSKQISKIDQKINASATTSMDQYTKDSSTREDANAATTAITDNSTKIRQAIASSTHAYSVIISDSSYISGITINQSINVVQNFLQNTDSIQSNINKVATTITQKSINTMNLVLYAGIGVILILVIIFAILLLGKSHDLADFFHRILPILIWFIMATLVTVIHVLAKPGYVTYTMPGETKKHIDVGKLLMWLFIYYVGFAVIIYGYFKFTRRGEGGYEGDGGYEDEEPVHHKKKKGTDIQIHISGSGQHSVSNAGGDEDYGE